MTSHPHTTFARVLGEALAFRGWNCKELAQRSGVGLSTIYHAKTETKFPSHAVVIRLADALSWPSLVDASLRERQRRCVVCRAVFYTMTDSLSAGRYCKTRCRNVANNRRAMQRTANTGRLNTQRLAEAREAIGRYCRGCEPEGLCRTKACELRPVSPLPLVRRAA